MIHVVGATFQPLNDNDNTMSGGAIRITSIDEDIETLFGVNIDDYFFNWAHKKLGDNITLQLSSGEYLKVNKF